jgi:outer membrane lipoprotein SlyB
MRLTAGALAVGLTLAGCATNGGVGPGIQTASTGSPAGATGYVSPIRSQANDFKATVVEGALLGAVAGGLIGAITSGGDMRRTLVSAAAGGAVGAVGGYIVAGQKAQYARKEEALDALVADARMRNDKLVRINATADDVIKKRRVELAELKAKTVAADERKRKQQELMAKLEADQQAVEQAIVNARENGEQLERNSASLKQQFPDAGTRPLDDMTVGFNRSRQDLDRKYSDIKRILSEAQQPVKPT